MEETDLFSFLLSRNKPGKTQALTGLSIVEFEDALLHTFFNL